MSVYFISAPSCGLIKIGHSKNVRKRLQGLKAMSPVDLVLIGEIEGARPLERQLHSFLIDHHHRDEWFRASVPVAQVISQLLRGTFDMTRLPSEGRSAWAWQWEKSGKLRLPNGRARRIAA